ncbi:butanol dehydrogenase [Bacillus sp. FJAT-27264]|uniref:iron-containing alcohol dehydrogenase n=1 Tax=Paenibacillus sp. (strain DSM 101736 / FJAT-27264) TaxID=1850362 RepID=UPI000807BEE9|nr:iron-containing alcohol dehydrogenase [Bacillus sp. FJAT-27264]OBZ08792.1 butanol dehydrogenase [Bacillus sp. FJAT-27264]
MKNFYFRIPTEIYFGKGQIEQLAPSILTIGRKVLLVYGGGSIKQTGLYQAIQAVFEQNGIEFVELSGVEPNPRLETVNRGVELCRENNVDVILAVGGGSVIDCAKVVSAGVKYDGNAWDLVLNSKLIKDTLPLVTVLTTAATGSEMNRFAVISNMNTNDKIGVQSELFYPRVSILDPEYTFSVPKNQTAAGVADIMSHVIERYFNNVPGAYLQDRLSESLLKTCIHYGPIAYREPDNYDARANLMWASSLAIDGVTWRGNDVRNTCHPIEHQLSAYYDITHGVGLAIITPHWMRHVLNDTTVGKFVDFGVNVWGIDSSLQPFQIANQAISKLEEFYAVLEIPNTLREVGIGEDKLEIMAEKSAPGLEEAFSPLTSDDVLAILKASL